MESRFGGIVGRALAGLVLVALISTAVGVAPGLAQEPGVLIQGRVLWLAAGTMVVAPYVLTFGVASAINVDLSQADQEEYAGLKTGDAVAVTGMVAPEGDRVIATSIRRLATS